MYAYTHAFSTPGDQKMLDHLELELQVIVSCPHGFWALNLDPEISLHLCVLFKTNSTDHWATFQFNLGTFSLVITKKVVVAFLSIWLNKIYCGNSLLSVMCFFVLGKCSANVYLSQIEKPPQNKVTISQSSRWWTKFPGVTDWSRDESKRAASLKHTPDEWQLIKAWNLGAHCTELDRSKNAPCRQLSCSWVSTAGLTACITLKREELNASSKFQELPEASELVTSCLKEPPFRTSCVLKGLL